MKAIVTIAVVAAAGIAGAVLIVASRRKDETNDKDDVKSRAREKFRQLKEKFGCNKEAAGCKCCKDACDDENSTDEYDEFDLDGNDF